MFTKTKIPVTRETLGTDRDLPASRPGFGSLREEMERLFDAFEPRFWSERAGAEPLLRPAMDLSETESGFTLTTELAGLTPDDVSVKIANGTLTISGEKSENRDEDEEKEGATWHLRERRWGSFQRAVALPEGVDRDKVEASFAKGVLTVTLPKSKEARAAEREVAIKAA